MDYRRISSDMAAIGIDLGTTNSCACVWKNGKTELVPNKTGKFLTPSAVFVDNGTSVVGDIAAERLITDPDQATAEFKRLMGTGIKTNLDGIDYKPEELSAMVLSSLVSDSERHTGEGIDEVVISVPAYFDSTKRSATKNAARLAGLNCKRLINEPSAAALAFLEEHGFIEGTFLVIDFGGGTLDVSLVDSFDNVIEIVAVSGNTVGGKDINEAIFREFLRYNELTDIDLTPEEKASLYRLSEKAKIAISDAPEYEMILNTDDKTYTMTLTEETLKKISEHILKTMDAPIRRVLHDGKIMPNEITDLILIGGTCKMPIVREYLSDLFGRDIKLLTDPETAVARGAAIFSGKMIGEKNLQEIVMTDVCPFSLGIRATDAATGETYISFLIPRNTPLPTSKVRSYYATVENQVRFTISIRQGESVIPALNQEIAYMEVPTPKCNVYDFLGDVRFTYDINGLLLVDVTTSDGQTFSKEIISEGCTIEPGEYDIIKKKLEALREREVDDEDIPYLNAKCERMIQESVGARRDMIISRQREFMTAIAKANPHKIRAEKDKFMKFLNELESDDLGLALPGEDDES